MFRHEYLCIHRVYPLRRVVDVRIYTNSNMMVVELARARESAIPRRFTCRQVIGNWLVVGLRSLRCVVALFGSALAVFRSHSAA